MSRNDRKTEGSEPNWGSLSAGRLAELDTPSISNGAGNDSGPSLRRHLQRRHVQMIAIGGTIGTGLFFGSGHALRTAGPLGALIAYGLVGSVAYASLCSLCEMTTWAPVTGSFPYFAGIWVDPALGFAVGWTYFYSTVISTAVEIIAAVFLVRSWHPGSSAVICTAVFLSLICFINLFSVRWFGEVEFGFSMIKIVLIIGVLLAGLIIGLGGGPQQDYVGFRYWKHPGALAGEGLVQNTHTNRLLGISSVLVQAAFSYQGMELVGIAASETESPRRNIPRAMYRVLYCITIIYTLGIVMVGMLVAYDDPALLQNSGVVPQSPFVIAINHVGVKVLPHITNTAILTSAFLAGNSFLFCSSRILYGLAVRGQAPRFLASCTTYGLPQNAVAVASALSLFSFVNTTSGAETVFDWFIHLSTTASFFSWLAINLTYICFYSGMQAQDLDLRSNTYNNRLQPYLAYWGCAWTLIFIATNGVHVFFGKFKVSACIVAYVNIPIFLGLYLGYKIIRNTHIQQPMERDFVSGIPNMQATELPVVAPANVWEHIVGFIS